jgi:hypothetical protein
MRRILKFLGTAMLSMMFSVFPATPDVFRVRIQNTLFSSVLKNGLRKPTYYSIQGLKGFTGTNTLAYWDQRK